MMILYQLTAVKSENEVQGNLIDDLSRCQSVHLILKEKLYLFLTNHDVEMTNNIAERTVKPYVINRKNFGRAT